MVKRSKERSIFIGFHAGPDLIKRVKELATEDQRTVSSMLRKIITDYLAERKK